MSSHRQIIGSIGALESWSRTVDRAARTNPARRQAPGSVGYWLSRLDADRFVDATDAQKLAAAEAMRRAYFQRLALKSAQVRRRRS